MQIEFPDGRVQQIEAGITGSDIAKGISPSLEKKAVAISLNGELKDLNVPLTTGGKFRIITKDDPEGLEILRHDTAHVLAETIKELYPDAQITIGPVIENGFFYDIYRDKPFTTDDFDGIEQRMREIVDRNEPIQREEWDRDEAIKYFESIGETFKAEIIRDIPAGQIISLYRQGKFLDLCRGPHLPSTGRLGKAFKLMKLAGAYWRGDSKNPMLQRIYGTAWASEEQLKQHLHMLEEAEKRDHRKLGREMDLFHMQDEAPGSVFWHPKGWTIYRELQNYIRRRISKVGYVEVNTPIMVDRILWEASGHWEKFHENMFISETEDKLFALKPMNCPCHVQIFRQGIKSYRDLPLRMAEFGCCHRNEPSGALHGLMRVRSFVQDDAHIFCQEDDITSETKAFCELLMSVYKDFGFTDVRIKFSDRPAKRAGTDATWDKAEGALMDAVKASGLEYTLNPGEGAFYGPKLEFVLRDAIGRDWQCGTLQVDFVLPERLDANYIGSDGEKHRPVMLHRAILGSIERFFGILIENYAGKLPLWLAPTQVVIATVVDSANEYAENICNQLKEAGLRVGTDLRNEKISYKVRDLSVQKIQYIAVVGAKEAEEQTISLRQLGSQDQTVMTLKEFVAMMKENAAPPA
ncbi:threonine--tRNA ligase [Candidatus Bodocaedibacter vickermanii]|uniref:Threonine--tRNA ligase n=1 Tax=Candidatus Bodocaedibacter vickermanii TaxID=2741701 RepID=A0A7L9RSX0_9PROT|nr:Threonine--tRNA ligase [Candidatus Paracaedibacteraceae bacterium 'Lake Konstanz']